MKVAVIGGGAAGFFAALAAKEANPNANVTIHEKSTEVLTKVLISGGGRCNVTHAQFDPSKLVEAYPRGGRTLLRPFGRFNPSDTVKWFESNGVPLKVESDNRIFPVSNSSASIADCLTRVANERGVRVAFKSGVNAIERESDGFQMRMASGECLRVDRVILATGGSRGGHALASALGVRMVSPIPSLFSFTAPTMAELAGISVQDVKLTVRSPEKWTERGPILMTHWGVSGPGVIRLSSWGARWFAEQKYTFDLVIRWLPEMDEGGVGAALREYQRLHVHQNVRNSRVFGDIPIRLWQFLVASAQVSEDKTWETLQKRSFQALSDALLNFVVPVSGKGAFKEEFVTCGGVDLNEVSFRTMESKSVPGLFFAGEVLDVDGITGGFNFQNAWTTGWIAGNSVLLSKYR